MVVLEKHDKLNIMKNVCVLLVQLHFIVHMSHLTNYGTSWCLVFIQQFWQPASDETMVVSSLV